MTANVLPTIFTIEIGDTPTLTFEAQNLREAHELCHEQWLKDDLAEAKSDGGQATERRQTDLTRPLWCWTRNLMWTSPAIAIPLDRGDGEDDEAKDNGRNILLRVAPALNRLGVFVTYFPAPRAAL
jgi:hypothetical protein